MEDSFGIKAFIGVFMAVIVGLVLIPVLAQQVGTSTDTLNSVNQSITFPANGSSTNLLGKAVVGTVSVVNGTLESVPASNFSVANNQVVDGVLTATLTSTLVTNKCVYCGEEVNITYIYQPTTYIPDAGARAIAGLVVVFFALAVLVVALYPTLKDGLLDLIQR